MKLRSFSIRACALAGLAIGVAIVPTNAFSQSKADQRIGGAGHMSGMGVMAQKLARHVYRQYLISHGIKPKGRSPISPDVSGSTDDTTEGLGLDPGDEGDDGYSEGPAGGQAETSIAVDSTGNHVVIGINDTRGFSLNPTSVSGFQYSDDGGVTFTDGGQLPVNTGTSSIGSTVFPEVFGDPEVKYLGGSNFAYCSIVIKKFGTSGTAQTLGVHVSTDYGHTWQGPYEITSATNPHGLLSGVNAFDAADKEFMDYDPIHGRLLVTWSNFTSRSLAPGGVEISATYCDNILSGSPTWSARQILGARAEDGQASCPRFQVGTNNAYVVWRTFPGTPKQNVGFAASTDDGATWTAAKDITFDFFTMDFVHGNDRNNTSPSLAVDYTTGNLYVVYANNGNHDGSDIAFQSSSNGGATFSAPVLINARPGSDGPQWFPWVTVDQSNERIHVFYLDQGNQSGDITDSTRVYSDNGGLSWSAPMFLTDRPFHCGYGNDTGQPNMGDYNQSVAQNGELFAVWAGTANSVGYNDGEPTSTSFTVPDAFFKRVSANRAALELGSVTFTNARGSSTVDTGGTVHFKIPVKSYALAYGNFTNVGATLTTPNANVTILNGTSGYPDVPAGGTSTNSSDFILRLGAGYVPGTPLELTLAVTSDQGATTLHYTQKTGTPVPTTVFSENFESNAPGTLPPGWTTVHAGGNNTVLWTTRTNAFGDTSNALFHINANDGLSGNNVRFERAFSPIFSIPAGADYVTLDFDVGYDTEDDPLFNVVAYDGVLLRITDQTAGHMLRSVQVEACADEFTTGSMPYYPKMLPRSNNSNYFQDMQVWAGLSNGMQHVHIKIHGIAGDRIQLRWEFTQDSAGTGADVHPAADGVYGVAVDNIVVNSVQSIVPPNHAPVANPDSFATNEDVPVSGNVLTNDTDADGDALTATLVTSPANGGLAFNSDGSFVYTPASGFHGVDTFTYKANDGLADSNVATVSITVDGRPTANAGSNQTLECAGATTPVTLDGSGSTDPEGETLTYVWTEGVTPVGTGAIVTVNATHGVHIYTLSVTDTHSQSSFASVTVTIADTTAPVITVNGSNPVTVLFGSSYTDAGATANDVCDGSVPVSTSGAINTSVVGTQTITYTAKDSTGNTATATRTVQVVYSWSNLLQPINDDGSSIFKLGSTIPVKFQLTGLSAGQIITAKIYVAKISGSVVGTEMEAISTSAADSGNTFRYDSSANQYIFNLATKGLSAGTWQIRVDLGDGATHILDISLK